VHVKTKMLISRFVLNFLLIVIFLFPWQDVGFSFPIFQVSGKIIVDSKYLIAGIFYLLAVGMDYLGKFYSQEKKESFDIIFDMIGVELLVNTILIILAYQGFVSLLVALVIFISDFLLLGIHLLVSKNQVLLRPNTLYQLKKIFLYFGIGLTLFYNLPFELWGIFVSEILLDIAALLSVITMYSYFIEWKEKYKKLDETI